MSDFTNEELSEAHHALQSTLHKCKKMDSGKMQPALLNLGKPGKNSSELLSNLRADTIQPGSEAAAGGEFGYVKK